MIIMISFVSFIEIIIQNFVYILYFDKSSGLDDEKIL